MKLCWKLVFGFTLSAALGSVSSADVVERVEAIVNKKAIYKSDVDRFRKLTPLRAKVDPLFNKNPIAQNSHPSDEAVVSFLTDDSLILSKYPVPDSDVEQEINGIQNTMKIDRETLRQAIIREGFQFEDYFELMRTALSKRQLIDRDIRNKATVSNDDIKAYYHREKAGSKNFRGSFHLYIIRFSRKTFKTPKLAMDEAQKAADALTRGEKFEDIAKRNSDDPSAQNGGDQGYLAYSEMNESVQSLVRKLGPGKTSDIADDGKSYYILKIADLRADVDPDFDKEHESIREKLLEGEFQHQIRLWLDRERAQNYVKINSKKS